MLQYSKVKNEEKNDKKAHVYLDHVIKKAKGEILYEAMFRKAEFYEFAKRENDAKTLFRNIVKESPKNQWADLSKQKLKKDNLKNDDK